VVGLIPLHYSEALENIIVMHVSLNLGQVGFPGSFARRGRRSRSAHISFGNGKVHASVCCSVAETSLTFVKDNRFKEGDLEGLGKPDGSPRFLNPEEKPGHQAGRHATYEAQRIKKVRLRRNALTMVGLHGNRVRWITITVRENIKDKKQFLYMVENLRKELHANGFTLKYTGMLERQDGKRRADGIGRGAWHLHALAYLLEDDWDYKAIQRIAVRRGMNIDMRDLLGRARASRKCADYMLKIEAVVKAAYAAKMETGEDFIYTLTSKGCDLPKRKLIMDMREALRFIEGYGFRKQTYEHSGGGCFVYYLLESEAFGRDIYDSC